MILQITADYNAGDYITETSTITDDDLQLVRRVAAAIKQQAQKFSSNWEVGDCFREDLLHTTWYKDRSPDTLYIKTGLLTIEDVERFSDFVPFSENGIHTIESIDIIEYTEKLL